MNGDLVKVVEDLWSFSTDDQLDGGVDRLEGRHNVAGVVAVVLGNNHHLM